MLVLLFNVLTFLSNTLRGFRCSRWRLRQDGLVLHCFDTVVPNRRRAGHGRKRLSLAYNLYLPSRLLARVRFSRQVRDDPWYSGYYRRDKGNLPWSSPREYDLISRAETRP